MGDAIRTLREITLGGVMSDNHSAQMRERAIELPIRSSCFGTVSDRNASSNGRIEATAMGRDENAPLKRGAITISWAERARCQGAYGAVTSDSKPGRRGRVKSIRTATRNHTR